MLFFLLRLSVIMGVWCAWPWLIQRAQPQLNFSPEQSEHWRWRVTLWWLILDVLLIELFTVLE